MQPALAALSASSSPASASITRAPVTTLPFLFEPELGADELRERSVEAIP